MAEIKLRLVIDPSGAIQTFEETMNALAQRAGTAPVAQNTMVNLRRGLESLRQELEKTEIGSERFNQLRRSIELTEKEIAKTSRSTNALDDTFTKIGFRLNGITSLFSILSSSFGGLIRESNAGELAAAKLTQALQNQGQFSQELVDDLKAFAAARQEAAAIDDDATVSIIGQLSALGLQGQALKDATVSVQDLATLMDGDMQGALRLVADAFQGNTQGLKRMKIEIDEADLKARGATAVIEALTKAVGGQAVAAGSTAAGEIKKLQLAMDDWRQAMGDVLKSGLEPLIAAVKWIVAGLKELPPSLQAAVLGLTAMASAFAFVNSSAGILPYVFIALGSAVMIIVNAIKEGNPLMAALGAAVGVLGVAVLALTAKLLLTSTTITTILIPALTALKVAMASHPILLLITGIAAVGAALWAMTMRTSEATEKLKALSEEAKSLGIPTLKERIAELSAEIEANNKKIETNIALKEQAAQLAGIVAKVDKQQLDNESQALRQRNAELQEQIKVLRDALSKAEQKRAKELLEEQTTNDPKVQIKIEELRVQAMQEGVAKRLALLDLEKKKQFQQWNEENLSEKQRQDLKNAYMQAYATKRTAIMQEAFEKERQEREKSAADYYDYTQHLKKLDEELALDLARTDEEKYDLKRLFLEREIADLEALGPRTLEQEKRLAEARTELKKLNNAEVLRLEREQHDLEQQLRELRTGDVAEENRREIAAIRDKYARLRELAIKHGKDISAINRAQAVEEREALQRQLDAQEDSKRAAEQRWRRENTLAMGAIGSITAGVREASNQWLISHRQAASEMDAIWLAIRNSAIGALTSIIAQLIEDAIVSAAVRAATTTATVASMATISAAAAPAAFAVNIASFGGAGYSAAASTAVASGAMATAMKALAIPFAQGGVFEPDQKGFIEGGQYELITPRRTAVDVLRQDLVPEVARGIDMTELMRTTIMPMLVRETRTVALQQPASNSIDDSRIVKRLERLERTLTRKDFSPTFVNFRDEEEIQRVVGSKVQRKRKGALR